MTHSLRTTSRRATTLALTFVLVIFVATAQNQTDQTASSPLKPFVKLNVLVLDDSNRAVSDVDQKEFRVFEDDVEQQISFFSKEQLPISYGLLVDNSGSLRSQLREVIETGKRIVNANRPEDEAFVMRFVDNKNIELLLDFTSDKTALDRSLDGLYPEGGQTALIDAVFVAAIRLAKRTQGDTNRFRRQALILISDGEDRASTSKANELFDFLQKNDIQIYVIGLVSQLDNDRGSSFARKPTRGESIDLLNRLARETGGQVFFPESHENFTGVVSDIMRDLRTQYHIGYNPLPNPKSKAYRNVKVKLERQKATEKRIVITRPGYFVRGE